MLQAQIIPQYINPPQNPQWANGSVKDTNGARWSVAKNFLHLFQQGMPAQIVYEQRQGQKGPYNVVTSVNGQPVGGGPQQAGQAALPIQRPPAVTPTDTKSEEMFVMGVVGRAMGSGKYEINDIHLLAKAATQAWRARAVPAKAPNDPGPDTEYGDGPGEPDPFDG